MMDSLHTGSAQHHKHNPCSEWSGNSCWLIHAPLYKSLGDMIHSTDYQHTDQRVCVCLFVCERLRQ